MKKIDIINIRLRNIVLVLMAVVMATIQPVTGLNVLYGEENVVLKESIEDFICTDEELKQPELLGEENTAVAQECKWDKYATNYYYGQLSTKEKAAYKIYDNACRKLLQSAVNVTVQSIKSNGVELAKVGLIAGVSTATLSYDSIEKVLKVFRYSNPQYYFLSIHSIVARSGSMTVIYMSIDKEFCLGSARTKATSAIEQKLTKWNKAIASEKTAIAKEKKIHDLIATHTKYAKNAYDQTVYGVLVKGKALCAGYAQAFLMLCNKAGIKAIIVTSDTHAWNKVKLSEKWYNVDCTWDDRDGDLSEVCRYTYMNRSTAKICSRELDGTKDHVQEKMWNTYSPACTVDAPVKYAILKNSTVTQSISVSDKKKTYSSNGVFSLGAVLTKGSGKLSYTSADTNVVTVNSSGKVTIKGCGKTTVTIVAAETTQYRKATKKVTISIVPVQQKIIKLESAGTRNAKITYRKDKKVSGYQIEYSRDKGFDNSVKVNVGGKDNYFWKVTGLASGKKYYFRVRSYRASSGGKVYGNWSRISTMKIK